MVAAFAPEGARRTVTVAGDRGRLERAAIVRTAREHLLPFVKLTFPRYEVNPVSRLVAAELEHFEAEVKAGRSPRLILELPPRVGKSELVSRRYPGWLLGRHPDWHIGVVSYGADLAERLSRDARRVVMSDTYAEVFARYELEVFESVEIDKTSKSVNYWRIAPSKDNPQPGGMLAVGVNGALTGEGFDVLILDDPLKNWEAANSQAAKDRLWDFYVGTLYDRLEPGAGIIIVQQRWATDDLVGRVLETNEVDEEGFDVEYLDKWRRITVPAQAEAGMEDALGREPGEWLPARYTTAQWERAKANNMRRNPRIWHAKFQQRPSPAEGAIFRPDEWFRFEEPPEDADGPVFVFIDTSFAKGRSSDYNVATVWRLERHPREQYRLLEVYRKRSPFPDLRKDILDICFRYELTRPANVLYFAPRVFIEDKSSGQSLVQEFAVPVQHPEHGRVRIPVKAWRPDGDKDSRAHAVTPLMAEGKVVLPRKAPWLREYLEELRTFQGEGSIAHDDQVDATTMGLILMGVQQPVQRRQHGAIPFRFVA